MQPIQKLFSELDIKIEDTPKQTTVRTNVKDTLNVYALGFPCGAKAELFPKNHNQLLESEHSGSKYGKGLDFSGVSHDMPLRWNEGEGIDLAKFEREKKKLSEFTSKLRSKLSPVGYSRKRVLSETDGEWDLDRKWDMKPFMNTYKDQSGIVPTLSVNVDFCFASRHNSESITKFGAFCWAIFSSIEDAGITCEVNLVQKTMGLFEDKHAKLSEFHTLVKRAGDYVDNASLARCFTAGFYRRAMFVMEIATCEYLGKKSSLGLGAPSRILPKSAVGELLLSIDNQTNDLDQLLDRILVAIGAKELVEA